jgi:hypothetical protein
MTDFKDIPLLGNGTKNLAECLSSIGVNVGHMTGPIMKIEDGPMVTAYTYTYGPNVHTLLGLANEIRRTMFEYSAEKVWLLNMDNDGRFLRYALSDDCGVDVVGKKRAAEAEAKRAAEKTTEPKAKRVHRYLHRRPSAFTTSARRASSKSRSRSKLSVSSSGGHRIFSADGQSHYIPSGWIHLTWTPRGSAQLRKVNESRG